MNTKYTAQEIEEMKARIDKMDRFEMARLWRFAPAGYPYFRSDLGLGQYFEERFKALEGSSPTISKALG